MTRHNKKRNTGLLYEFLIKHAAEGLVADDELQTRRAVKLIRRHFREGTELHREFKLFHALVNTYVGDRNIAARIMEMSRSAAKQYDRAKLDREKSLLIRGINHTFSDSTFYDKRVDEYKLYATIQTLLNNWRQGTPSDISKQASYEQEMIEHLTTPKQKNVLDEGNDEVDDLLVGLMTKKIDGKYNRLLNPEQIKLMNGYVYSMKNEDNAALKEAVDTLRQETLDAIDAYMAEQHDKPDIVERLAEVRDVVVQDIKEYDDKTLARYLRVAQLKHEILGDE